MCKDRLFPEAKIDSANLSAKEEYDRLGWDVGFIPRKIKRVVEEVYGGRGTINYYVDEAGKRI